MKIICIGSVKGGVGKTTISIFTAQTLAKSKRVLFIDLDPNNNATDYFLSETDPGSIEKRNVFHVLTKAASLADCLHESKGLSVLPATMNLIKASQELSTNPGLTLRLRNEIQKQKFDVCVIDTPPSLDPLSRAGFWSADLIMNPVSPSRWNLQALEIMKDEIKTIHENSDRKPELFAVQSMVTAKAGEETFSEISGVQVLKTAIVRLAAFKGLVDNTKPLKPDSKAGLMFDSLVNELWGLL